MAGKLGDQGLDTLEQRFQALRDQIGARPEACRPELEGALQALSQAIAAVRQGLESGEGPRPAPPGGRKAQEGGSSVDPPAAILPASPDQLPAAGPGNCETILSNLFNAIPDLITIIDRDFNIVMSNWQGFEVPEEMRRGQPKCYRVYHRRDRPCEDCHLLTVFATGQPQKVEKISDFDGRVMEITGFPILDESGQVSMVVEHIRDIQERHLAAQALKESEGRFRTLIEDSPESLFLTDAQGTILAASRVVAERIGKELSEIVGRSAFEHLPPEVAAHRRPFFEQAVATGRPVRFEDARDDRHFDVNFNPILDAGGKVSRLSVLSIDITDRKRAEQALRESESRFRAIFATAQDSIFIKDRSLRYTQVNPAMERLFGRSAADLIGRTDEELFGEEAGAHIRAVDQRVLNGEMVKETHTKPLQGAPATFHVIKVPLYDATGKVIAGLCGIARDITDLKRAAQALKESEARFRMVFEHAPDAYYLVDFQGNFVDFNRYAEEISGYDRQEIMGKNFQALPFLDGRQNREMAAHLQQARTGEIIGPLEYCMTRKDGRQVIMEARGLPIRIKGEDLVLVIARDITARKQAEAELIKKHLELQETAQWLEQSRNMLQLIIESIPVRVFWKDRDLRYLGCNTLFALDAGLNHPQQLLGQDDFAMGWREQADLYRTDDRQVMESRRPKMNIAEPQTTPAGATIWLKTSKVPLQMPNGEVFGVLGLYEDVTERHQAEEALQKSEELFRSLVENITLGIALISSDYRITMTNPAHGNMFHKHPREFIGKECFREFEKRQAICPHCPGAIAMATGQKAEIDTKGFRDDGSSFVARIHAFPSFGPDGEITGFIEVVEDITPSKRVEEALRESEQRFRLMAETIQDVFWIATPRIGKTVYVSPGYEYIWGRTREALYRNPKLFLETVHPEDRERVKTEIIAARERSIPWNHEYRIIRPDGTVRWMQNRGFPVRDDQGRVTLFTGVATDITERKALEQQLLQAQKMEAVGRLAGGVAHDFNNLLMAITGYGELMRARVLKEDPLYGYLENILKAGDRAAALTRQLLTFSRQKIIHPEVIDLNRVVLDLEPMLRRLIGEDLDLEVVTDRRPGAVKADPGQMDQIIMNLVVNARDAMPQGGRLTLKTAPVNFTVGCQSRFGLTPPGAYVMLEVQDTGVGMDEATQSHIFEPFFTTKEVGKGTGLGLSTVYGIVKQSGGYLDVTSAPGAGSAFTIYFPRLEAIVEPPKAKIPITAGFRGEETILLVEDEDMLRGLLAKFLRLYGYTVLEARHGGEALLTCERHPGPIHLMVTDVVMPQMSGRELVDRLTPLRPEMRVLYMSGYAEDALVQHGVADLAVTFLQKPFRPIELVRRVHAVLHLPMSQ